MNKRTIARKAEMHAGKHWTPCTSSLQYGLIDTSLLLDLIVRKHPLGFVLLIRLLSFTNPYALIKQFFIESWHMGVSAINSYIKCNLICF